RSADRRCRSEGSWRFPRDRGRDAGAIGTRAKAARAWRAANGRAQSQGSECVILPVGRWAPICGARRDCLGYATMPITLDGKLVVAISSRAVFDFEEENLVFERDDDAAYMALQRERLDVCARPGVAGALVRKLLRFDPADR